jgi:hypothetical protein
MTRFSVRAVMRVDKKKVIDEVWSDERIQGFLQITPVAGAGQPDFQRLLRAYRSMRAEDFARFVTFFVAAGHDVDARNEFDETFAEHVQRHRHAGPFIAAIETSRRPTA